MHADHHGTISYYEFLQYYGRTLGHNSLHMGVNCEFLCLSRPA